MEGERTAHTGTLPGYHARNRILKHQPPRALLTLRLSNNPVPVPAPLMHRANGPSERTRSSQEHVRERLAAAHARIIPAHDVLAAKVRKHVLQVPRLERKAAPRGAGGDGDGDAVRGEVRDEPRGAGEELHVRPVRVLRCVALGDVVVDRERDVGKEGEQMGRCGAFGWSEDKWVGTVSGSGSSLLGERGLFWWNQRRTFAHETGLYLPGHLYAIRCQNGIWATGQLDGGW
jgi:hypothetical protein